MRTGRLVKGSLLLGTLQGCGGDVPVPNDFDKEGPRGREVEVPSLRDIKSGTVFNLDRPALRLRDHLITWPRNPFADTKQPPLGDFEIYNKECEDAEPTVDEISVDGSTWTAELRYDHSECVYDQVEGSEGVEIDELEYTIGAFIYGACAGKDLEDYHGRKITEAGVYEELTSCPVPDKGEVQTAQKGLRVGVHVLFSGSVVEKRTEARNVFSQLLKAGYVEMESDNAPCEYEIKKEEIRTKFCERGATYSYSERGHAPTDLIDAFSKFEVPASDALERGPASMQLTSQQMMWHMDAWDLFADPKNSLFATRGERNITIGNWDGTYTLKTEKSQKGAYKVSSSGDKHEGKISP